MLGSGLDPGEASGVCCVMWMVVWHMPTAVTQSLQQGAGVSWIVLVHWPGQHPVFDRDTLAPESAYTF